MNLIRKILNSRSRWAEILRYTCGCGCGIMLKIALSSLFTYWGISFAAGYLICQVVILLESFIFHYLITFKRGFSSWRDLLRTFGKYTYMVMAIKVLDYVLAVVVQGNIKSYLEAAECSEMMILLVNGGIIAAVSVFIFVLRYLLYRVIFRRPDLDYYTGKVQSVFVVHAMDREIAENAASGGAVTALLTAMLEQHTIQGALVARMVWPQTEQPYAEGFIAKSREELISAQGSIYFDFPLLSGEVMKKIRAFDGQLAVVALPCQVQALRKMCAADAELAGKIKVVIGLFCGHATRRELLPLVMKKAGIELEDIASFRFRRGPWRGKASAVLQDGRQWERPSGFYNLYQNLFTACAERCAGCFDHYAEAADIACGDIWIMKYRKEKIKPSIVAVRTPVGGEVIANAAQKGAISLEEKDQLTLFKANSRSVIYHKAVAARAGVLARYGKTVAVPEGAAKPRWNELLAARIAVKYAMMDARKVTAQNRRRLKFWLYVFKGLTSF